MASLKVKAAEEVIGGKLSYKISSTNAKYA
jgi:hypothetical protein